MLASYSYSAFEGANKKYVDDAITASLGSGEYLPLRGGTMSGDIIMSNYTLSGVYKMQFYNGSGFVNSSPGVITATMQILRGQTYTAPTNNNDYTQKKYVDDKIAAAVIEATQGGLTETVADTKYLRLDGTNEPTGNYVWNNNFTSTNGIYFNEEGTSYINNNEIAFKDSGTNRNGKINLGGSVGEPRLEIHDDSDNTMPLYGAYKSSNNDAGYYVTETYLKSAEYTNNAAFVKKTGDTMSGTLSMNGNTISQIDTLNFVTQEGGFVIVGAAGDSESGYSFKIDGYAGSGIIPVQIKNIAAPTTDDNAVNLAYLKQYCEGKTQEVTLTGVVDTILAHNTEYTIKDFTALTLVCDSAKTAENHGYIKFPNVPVVPTLTGFSGIDGDDITQAAANEVWEFSCFKGYMLFKNWGVAA